MTDPTVDWANYRPPVDGRRCRSHDPAVERARYASWHRGTGLDPPWPVRCILGRGHPGRHESWMYEWPAAEGPDRSFEPPMGRTGRPRV